jgi:hypothetical protein
VESRTSLGQRDLREPGREPVRLPFPTRRRGSKA